MAIKVPLLVGQEISFFVSQRVKDVVDKEVVDIQLRLTESVKVHVRHEKEACEIFADLIAATCYGEKERNSSRALHIWCIKTLYLGLDWWNQAKHQNALKSLLSNGTYKRL